MGNEKMYEKLTKHFKIGEYDFTLGLNREMAVRFFRKQPLYFDCVKKLKNIETVNANTLDDLDFDKLAEQIELMSKLEEHAKEIVDYALPEMLAFGDTRFVNVDTKCYAEKVIKYCDENGVLYNEIYDDNTIVKGFYMLVMEFISVGFTHGLAAPKNKKPLIAIVTE